MNPTDRQPPRIGRWLVRLWPLGARRQEVESDLLELFAIRAADRGKAFASRRYVLDALSLWQCRTPDGVATPPDRYRGFREMKCDIIFAARLFRRQPGLFGATVAGLAIAIGISTAVFSITKAVTFGGYGIAEPESVYRVALSGARFTRVTGPAFQGNWPLADYLRLQESASSLTLVASAFDGARYALSPNEANASNITFRAVTGSYFPALGMRPALGRLLTPADDVPGAATAVIAHGFWKNSLGGDPTIVGRNVWLNGQAFTIVGVADRAHGRIGGAPAFWTTIAGHADMSRSAAARNASETRSRLDDLRRVAVDPAEYDRLSDMEADVSGAEDRSNPAVDVFGRVKPGVTRAQAEAQVRSIAAVLERELNPGHQTAAVQLESLDRENRSIVVAAVLMTTVGLVVLLACANVANLLLASAASRRREIGTRLALGASRGRVVRQLLTESLLLGGIAGAFGLLVAIQVLPSFAALLQVPPVFDVSPDGLVYTFVALLTIAVGIIAGLAPARYGRRGNLVSALQIDQPSAPRRLPGRLLRSMLIGGQAAASVVLLVLAALLTRSVVESAGANVGFDAGRFLSVSASVGGATTKGSVAREEAFWRGAIERVRQVPGVADAALVNFAPFNGGFGSQMLNGRSVDRNETSPGYFATLGIRLIKGRTYTDGELRAQAPVAVISASLAREFWGAEDPVGASLERVWGRGDARLKGIFRQPPDTRVIGVVADTTMQLKRPNAPTIYLPLSESSVPRLVVRAHTDPRPLTSFVHSALQSLDPGVRTTSTTVTDGLQRERERPRMLALLAILVGATAVGLAIIGLFGVTSFVVEQRTHEITVRRALGASNGQLVTLLFRESLRPVGVGLACGLLLSLLSGRIVQSVLYGVSSRDPLAIIAAIVILLSAVTAAVWLPAHRATRVNPAQLLKMG